MRVIILRRRIGHGERGAVLLLVAVGMPVFMVLLAFVVDVGNHFVHHRHLQTQADAAALAAAQEFRSPCSDAAIIARATSYSGDEPGSYNAQLGGTDADDVHMLVNSSTFYNQPTPSDDTTVAPPCSAGMIDVKMTETDLPWFIKSVASLLPGNPVPSTDFINAHARVSINQKDSSSGALPVGVPDVNPKAVRAYFVNESTHQVLGSAPLTRVGTSGGLAVWDNATAPEPIRFSATDERVGVVVALGGVSSTTCGQPLVQCYDAGSGTAGGLPAAGILSMQGWAAAPSGAQTNAPALRAVTLVPGTCPDPYFVSQAAQCTIGVRARVDFGPNPTAVGARLTAVVRNNRRFDMTYDAASGMWQSATTIPIDPGSDPISVNLEWQETAGFIGTTDCSKGGNACRGTFPNVQRAFSASEVRSGPIKVAQLYEDGVQWANAVERCSAVQTSCTHRMVVRIGLQGSLQNATGVGDPIVSLRIVGGSQNQSLDCDPALPKLKDELAAGCAPPYRKNTGTACPATAGALWSTAQPWPCVALQTGSATNQVPAGMNQRILGSETASTCTAPNHWSDYPNLDPTDPRIIQVLLTPFGSFSGSGSTTVPVSDFATFYVTGWTGQGQGFNNPCQGNGDDPVPNNDAGYIVGHFIKYIDTLNPGGGTTPCDLAAFGTCVAVMTR
jgi:hypothetical protein